MILKLFKITSSLDNVIFYTVLQFLIFQFTIHVPRLDSGYLKCYYATFINMITSTQYPIHRITPNVNIFLLRKCKILINPVRSISSTLIIDLCNFLNTHSYLWNGDKKLFCQTKIVRIIFCFPVSKLNHTIVDGKRSMEVIDSTSNLTSAAF